MKRISDLLKNKKKDYILRGSSFSTNPDEKTIEKVFIETATRKVLGIQAGEIKEAWLKDKKLKIKTTHPIIAGEIWKKRELLIGEVNKILGSNFIEEIKVS
jgi:hypothetical protein